MKEREGEFDQEREEWMSKLEEAIQVMKAVNSEREEGKV